jgi:RNA polymerase sigma factor (sigma-70 family)
VNLSASFPTTLLKDMTESDELLAVRCQLGEPEALDMLIARWHPALWSYVRRVTGNPDAAADAVQDAWVRILRALPGLREPARLRPWMFSIARRVLMDRFRAQYAAPVFVDTEPADLAEPDDRREAALAAEELHAVLDALPVSEREVLALFYLEELSLNELADVLSVPVGTVKSRLFRARRMLRARLVAEKE